jgi:periplasmic divalent cation tolerance protein
VTEYVVILVTTGSEAEAETIATTLVAEQLVACVNLLNPIRSLYRWEGKLVDDREWLLMIKTQAELFSAVEARIKTLHSYQVPEVIALPILAGSDAYLRWISDTTAIRKRNE